MLINQIQSSMRYELVQVTVILLLTKSKVTQPQSDNPVKVGDNASI